MDRTNQELKITIHNGRETAIGFKRMVEFDTKSLLDRLFKGRDVDSIKVIEQLGPWSLDFTNVFGLAEDVPDIDSRSIRLFTIWAEDTDKEEVLGLVRGFFVLLPFIMSPKIAKEYYMFQEDVPYYPMAIISSLRTTIQEEARLDWFLDQMRDGISSNWKELREKTIKRLPKDSDLWKRFVLSFDNIIHFTFLCPSIDRELIDALQRNDYRLSGVMQLLASPSPSYDEATVKHHLTSARKVMQQFEKNND